MPWWWPPADLNRKLDQLLKEVRQVSIDQSQFDTDLQTLVAAVTGLVAAIEAWIAAHPPGDFTVEDQAVVNAAKVAQAEIDKLAPPA